MKANSSRLFPLLTSGLGQQIGSDGIIRTSARLIKASEDLLRQPELEGGGGQRGFDLAAKTQFF